MPDGETDANDKISNRKPETREQMA